DWAFDYLQRSGEPDPGREKRGQDEIGGSVYLRLTTRSLEQPRRDMDARLRDRIIAGAYWMRPPGPNCELVIAYQGTVASEAVAAAGMLAGFRRDIGVLAVTSADRLHAGWQAALRE